MSIRERRLYGAGMLQGREIDRETERETGKERKKAVIRGPGGE